MQSAATPATIEARPRRLSSWISFGPGLLFALSMLGPSSLVENVTIGASQGYRLLWILVAILACRFVWLNISARYVLVSGETLLQGYGRYGRWLPWLVFAALLVQRHLSNLYKVVLMGEAANLLLPLPLRSGAAVWSVVLAFIGLFVLARGIRTQERWLRIVIAVMGGALVVAAILSRPHVPGILRGLFIPSLGTGPGPYSSLLLITALIGSEAGALTNLSYSYFVLEKGWRDVSFLRRQRLDLLCSVGSIFVVDALLQIAAAGTLLPAHLVPRDAQHLVAVFSTTLGMAGRIIFAFGLWAVSFSGFVAGTAGYALIGSDIWRSCGPRPVAARDGSSSRAVRLTLVSFWAISPLYILFMHVRTVWLVLVVSSLSVLLLPGLGIALMVLTNDRRRMGPWRNGLAANLALGAVVVTSLYISVKNALALFGY